MTKKSNSRQEDDRRAEVSPDRVTKVHGGQVVEAISLDDLESVNDADCKHVTLVRDPTETEFNAFVCANEKCSEVVLFNKTK